MATRRIALQIRWNKLSAPLENLLAAIHRYPDEAARVKMIAEFGRFLDTLGGDELGQVASEYLCAALRPAEHAADARFIDRILAYNRFSDNFKALCLDQCLLAEASRSSPDSFSRLEKLIVGYRTSYDELDPHQAPITDRFRSVVLAGAVPLFDLLWPGDSIGFVLTDTDMPAWPHKGQSRGSLQLFKRMFSLIPARLLKFTEWIFWRDCAEIAQFLLEIERQGQITFLQVVYSLHSRVVCIADVFQRPEHEFSEIVRAFQILGINLNDQDGHYYSMSVLSKYDESSDDVVFPIFVRLRKLGLNPETLPKLLPLLNELSQSLLELELELNLARSPRQSINNILPRFLMHYKMYPVVSEPHLQI